MRSFARSFARAGLEVVQGRGARDYRGVLKGVDNVEIAYLSASEIAAQLARGTVHLGITGEDLIRENIHDADKRVMLIESLGFGSANVVVAVPQAWIDVRTMADLDDVATYRFLEETIAHLTKTLEVEPQVVAHDLHPDFLSTRLAQSLGLPAVSVQHHHAHVAAVLAEHGRTAPTLGLALDGFGLGTDGGCSNNRVSVLDEMRTAALLQKVAPK